MTAYETGAETIILGFEMGGDEGKDIKRDAVDANERVPPFANSGRDTLAKLRHFIKVKLRRKLVYSVSSPKTFATYDGEDAVRFSSLVKANASCETDRSCPG
jgi:hypothetical protein